MIGALVARRWHFGSDIVDAIRHHHAPSPGRVPTLVDLVHVSDSLVHALDLAGVPDEIVPPLAADAWNRLALTQAQCDAALQRTERELDELCEELSV